MRVALVHDYIKEYGGAERVLEALHELYPDAPVFTSVYLPEYLGPHKERFVGWDIRTSFLQFIPFKAKLISPFRLLAPIAFHEFDFSEFDVIITSATGAYFPNILRKHSAKLICYCHTPPRYLYGYATAREWKKNPVLRVLGETANHFLRILDNSAAQNVDVFIANSQEVAGRIKKFYRKEAVVIYPPVDVFPTSSLRRQGSSLDSRLHGNDSGRKYYLAGGRLARAKHVDLIVKTFAENGLPLKVFGKAFAGYGEELRRIVNREWQSATQRHSGEPRSSGVTPESDSGQARMTRIEFLGEVSDEKKWELLAGAKAYLFASEDEDFGILPVEAMAAGTPVIAYRSGGVQESVVENKTGLFFDELSVESLTKALKQFEKTKFDMKVLQKRAEGFSKERFQKEISEFVQSASK